MLQSTPSGAGASAPGAEETQASHTSTLAENTGPSSTCILAENTGHRSASEDSAACERHAATRVAGAVRDGNLEGHGLGVQTRLGMATVEKHSNQ